MFRLSEKKFFKGLGHAIRYYRHHLTQIHCKVRNYTWDYSHAKMFWLNIYGLILILLIVCFFFYCSLMFCVRCRESHLLRRDSPQHHITCNSLLCLICLHRDRVNTICWILTTIHYLEVHFLQILITIWVKFHKVFFHDFLFGIFIQCLFFYDSHE